MGLPAIITRWLPSKDLKPKGEIITLDEVPVQANQVIVLPKELDPTNLSTITMKFDREFSGYYFYKLHDSETGYREEVLIQKAYSSLAPDLFDEAIRQEKLKFRLASTNLKRNKLI